MTLSIARSLSDGLGISRVTDITQLDYVGIPVYASIRPGAVEGSLCVNAGKGILPIEAEVGAIMEAIEFALAEPEASAISVEIRSGRDILDCRTRPDSILDLCPIARRKINLDAPLACVTGTDFESEKSMLVPAEIVILPYVNKMGTGAFGSNSNGLASGNTRDEALIHGLLELIERDIRSFQFINSTYQKLVPETLPSSAKKLHRSVEAAGLKICVRTAKNEFGLPFFEAVIHDPFNPQPQYLNGGYGCHLIAEIALIRAITEAVQSRLSWIHGGRDDLASWNPPSYEQSIDSNLSSSRFARYSAVPEIQFEQVAEQESAPRDLSDAIMLLLDRLRCAGIRHLITVPFTASSDKLQVLRVIAPGLEYLDSGSPRVGPRIRKALDARAG